MMKQSELDFNPGKSHQQTTSDSFGFWIAGALVCTFLLARIVGVIS